MAEGGSNSLWTRTLDRYTRAGLPECVVSTGDSTVQNTDKGHTHNPRREIKIPGPAGNRTRTAGLEGRESTDHATATNSHVYFAFNFFANLVCICYRYSQIFELCTFWNDKFSIIIFWFCTILSWRHVRGVKLVQTSHIGLHLIITTKEEVERMWPVWS